MTVNSSRQLAIMDKIFNALPAAARQRAMEGGLAVNDAFAGGITSGFAVLSIRGKAFRIKYMGEETTLVETDNRGLERPMYAIDVVLVAANPHISKTWYEHGYVEGASEMPDCFSNNGLTPDPGSPKLQNQSCLKCRWNQWGSNRSQGGSGRGKDCADNKRIAVVPANDLENAVYGGPMLLRFPPASLAEVLAYAKSLAAMKIPANSIITSLSFDPTAEYPKLTLAPQGPLNDAQFAIVQEHESSDTVQRILSSVVEEVQTYDRHDGVTSGVTAEQVAQAVSATTSRTAAKAPSEPVQRQTQNQAVGQPENSNASVAPRQPQQTAFQTGGKVAPPPHDAKTGEIMEEVPDERRITMRQMGMSEARILKVLGPAKMRAAPTAQATQAEQAPDPRIEQLMKVGLSYEDAVASLAEDDAQEEPEAEPEPAPVQVSTPVRRGAGRPPKAAGKPTSTASAPPVSVNGAAAGEQALAEEDAPMPQGFEDLLSGMIGKNRPTR